MDRETIIEDIRDMFIATYEKAIDHHRKNAFIIQHKDIYDELTSLWTDVDDLKKHIKENENVK